MTIRLLPAGVSIDIPAGTPLRDALFSQGIEFPCGGRGRCKKCRIRFLEGPPQPTPDELSILSEAELALGDRLACRQPAPGGNCVLEVTQWEAPVLSDDSTFVFTAREGRGVAIDLGTTTVVAQHLDLATGNVLAVRTSLNPQAVFGADIMTRIEAALGGSDLTTPIRRHIDEVTRDWTGNRLIAGNTAMHHFYCGFDVEPLSRSPFETPHLDLVALNGSRFLPCLGGFVGSDILVGILATGLDRAREPAALIDLGTNGEIVVAHEGRLVCASTAAGPAFEGGRISCGMRAATGAIAAVELRESGEFHYEVLGGGAPRGICGSGLVDVAATALDAGGLLTNGRLVHGALRLTETVVITQPDIRELQLAKAAIAAGLEILLAKLGLALPDLARIYLAGAFGNYVNVRSARRIGLLDMDESRIVAAGNTSLLGVKMALFQDDLHFGELRRRIEHVPLGSDPEFQERYVGSMQFPG